MGSKSSDIEKGYKKFDGTWKLFEKNKIGFDIMKLSINECTKIVQMIIRLSLGTMFLLAGVGKLSNPEAFIQRIDSYSIIPDFFTSTVITLLPMV